MGITTGDAPPPPVGAARVLPARRRLAQRTWRVLRFCLAFYLGLVAVLFSFQVALIFPGRTLQGKASSAVQPVPGTELVRLPTPRGEVVALFGPALRSDGRPDPEASRRPTMVYFYGNGMCLKDAQPQLESFRRLGANVLIPEYLGYGMSGGSAGEASCYATADAAFAHLHSRRDIDPGRIIAAGWSLGGAVAVDLASRHSVCGLATFSAFSSMTEMARRQHPLIPVSLLLKHRFESQVKMRRVHCPVFLAHGREDSLVPFSMCGQLASACGGPLTCFCVETGGHGDLFDAGGAPLMQALGAFLRSL
jgi:fermentation-respiration switch protein FrsA (DUF1100 family)